MNKYAQIDFEFYDTAEAEMTLVCASIILSDTDETFEYWLNDNSCSHKLVDDLHMLNEEGYIFLAHQVSAEASSFISLGLAPEKFKWIDTFIEFRMLTNHFDMLQYGDHYIDGKVKTLKKPKSKWLQTEEERLNGGTKGSSGKLNHSLASAVYRFCDKIKIDTKHKDEMRDIIISGDHDLIEENREAIQQYCTDDVKYLNRIRKRMVGWYNRMLPSLDGLLDEMLWRGESMARTAKIERLGYPIKYEETKNFAHNVPLILKSIQTDINKKFPEIGAFQLNKKTRAFVRKEQPIRDWIKNEGLDSNWMLTDTKRLSLSLDAFKQHFDFLSLREFRPIKHNE